MTQTAYRASAGLTPRQLEVVGYINKFRQFEQCNPTYSEISTAFGWSSANSAVDHLRALERKGAIEFRPGSQSRGYRVLWSFINCGTETAVTA